MAHELQTNLLSGTIQRPWIPPGCPVLQALGGRNGVSQAQACNPEQFGETANHHQVGMLGHERNQRLLLPLSNQR